MSGMPSGGSIGFTCRPRAAMYAFEFGRLELMPDEIPDERFDMGGA
jgi:hypothetical protein